MVGSLSNLLSKVEDARLTPIDKFRFESNIDPKTQFLEPQPQIIPKPKIKNPVVPKNNFEIEYRLIKRKDEFILQKTQYNGNHVIWVSLPTIEEEDENEVA